MEMLLKKIMPEIGYMGMLVMSILQRLQMMEF